MDSPSLDMPRTTVLSQVESEAEGIARQVDGTRRPAQSGIVLIAGLGNPVAVDYAAFLSRHSEAGAVVIADEMVRLLVESPIRSVAIDEVLRSTSPNGGELGPADSLILFIDARSTARQRREFDDIVAIAHRRQARFVGIISSFRVPSR